MSEKSLIITSKQLDEILGSNLSYLDNSNSDFKLNGSNEVYSGEKTVNSDSEPYTTDKNADQQSVNYGPWTSLGKTLGNSPVYSNGVICCSKKEWIEKNIIKESNSSLEKTNITVDPTAQQNMGDVKKNSAGAHAIKNNGMSYTNATTIKSRLKKLKDQANKGDLTALKAFNDMGGDALADSIDRQLKNKSAAVKRDKENRSNLGFTNVYQKEGGSKTSGNGKSHTPKANTTFTPINNE